MQVIVEERSRTMSDPLTEEQLRLLSDEPVMTYQVNGFTACIVGPKGIFDFKVRKHCREGFYCGYLQIPGDHPLFREIHCNPELGESFPFFHQGITYVKPHEHYVEVGFDTAHLVCDLHVPLDEEAPPELIRNTWESIRNDPPNLRTVKTRAFVEDCLRLASQHLSGMH